MKIKLIYVRYSGLWENTKKGFKEDVYSLKLNFAKSYLREQIRPKVKLFCTSVPPPLSKIMCMNVYTQAGRYISKATAFTNTFINENKVY